MSNVIAAVVNNLMHIFFTLIVLDKIDDNRLIKKRELTRAGELLETDIGGEGAVNRRAKAPLVLLTNVFTSLPSSRFTVKGLKSVYCFVYFEL